MSAQSRTYRLARLLIVTAMMWGFAVPVVHLACGMTASDTSVLCDEHEAMHGPEDANDVRGHTHGEQPAEHHHDAATHQQHHSWNAIDSTPYDTSVECCLVDAPAIDYRAQLVSVTDMPAPVVTVDAAPLPVETPVKRGAIDAGPSPPATLQVLFSVFLI